MDPVNGSGFPERLPDAAQIRFGRSRQRSAGTDQTAEFLFQVTDGSGEIGLGNEKLCRRAADGAGSGDRNDLFDLVKTNKKPSIWENRCIFNRNVYEIRGGRKGRTVSRTGFPLGFPKRNC